MARADAGGLKIEEAEHRPPADLPAVNARYDAGELPGKTVLIP
jgi:hypothetical protein